MSEMMREFKLWVKSKNLTQQFKDELIAKVGLIHQDAFYRGVDEERERHQ